MELIGVGIDLVDIVRVERMLARHGDRVIARFLTDRERAYVVGKYRPAMHIAARIAAKEAAYKALQSLPGARAVSWHHLEVERETEGRPYLVLSGLAHELAERDAFLRFAFAPGWWERIKAIPGALRLLRNRRPM